MIKNNGNVNKLAFSKNHRSSHSHKFCNSVNSRLKMIALKGQGRPKITPHPTPPPEKKRKKKEVNVT